MIYSTSLTHQWKSVFPHARVALAGYGEADQAILSWDLVSRGWNKLVSSVKTGVLGLANFFLNLWSLAGKSVLHLVLTTVMVGSLMIGTAYVAPIIYYHLFPHRAQAIESQILSTDLGGKIADGNQYARIINLPPVDQSLPEGEWIVIDKIGMKVELIASESGTVALDEGVWRDTRGGEIGSQDQPVIVAAHRFGWKWWWQDETWKEKSFYELPELEPGDVVKLIKDQRQWTYEIYAGEETNQISDWQADLILYTCKDLSSDIKHVRYGRLVNEG